MCYMWKTGLQCSSNNYSCKSLIADMNEAYYVITFLSDEYDM